MGGKTRGFHIRDAQDRSEGDRECGNALFGMQLQREKDYNIEIRSVEYSS